MVPSHSLFGGMTKIGPGSDADTMAVLQQLPSGEFMAVSYEYVFDILQR